MGKVNRKNSGNMGDLMITGICILAMSAVMIAYIQCAGIIQQKLQAGQLARKYLLKMETCGCLLPEDYFLLQQELETAGITDLDFSGTTFESAGYGQTIVLGIRGKLKGEMEIVEYRTSTAKY